MVCINQQFPNSLINNLNIAVIYDVNVIKISLHKDQSSYREISKKLISR